MRRNKYFTEAYGLGLDVANRNTTTDHHWYHQNIDATVQGNTNRENQHHIERPGFDMTGWQEQIYNRMLLKQDTFAGIPPAAGKTAPMQNAWTKLFTESLMNGIDPRDPKFPRILYIAKTKQLAMEGIFQNFQEWIYELISTIPKAPYNKYQNYHPGDILAKLGLPGIDPNTLLNGISQNQIHQVVQTLSAVKVGGISSNVLLSPIFYLKPIIVTTPIITPADGYDPINRVKNASKGYTMDYKQVSDLVKNYSKYFSMIVIDEFQQYLPMPGKDLSYGKFTEDSEKNFDMIFDIMKYAAPPGQCGIQLLTGTVNKNTATQFCTLMNSELNRKLVPLIFSGMVKNEATGKDEQAGNRSKLTVVPLEKMATPQERLALTKSIISNKQSRSIMIIFSTRRTATTGIFNLLSQLCRVLPPRDPKSLLSKPVPDEVTLGDMYNQTKSSKNYINPNFNALNYPDGLVDNNLDIQVNDIEFLKFFDVDAAEQQGDDTNKPTTYLAKADENNLLYQGVLRGVGVMVGKMDDRMKAVIQKLFRAEKLYLLLATDSLGIGANVMCKHIYLPNLDKPDGGLFGAIDDSSLVQLINRAGRQPNIIPNAFIYCSLKDYPRINQAVNEAPENFVSEIPFGQISDRVKDKNSVLRSLAKSLF